MSRYCTTTLTCAVEGPFSLVLMISCVHLLFTHLSIHLYRTIEVYRVHLVDMNSLILLTHPLCRAEGRSSDTWGSERAVLAVPHAGRALPSGGTGALYLICPIEHPNVVHHYITSSYCII